MKTKFLNLFAILILTTLVVGCNSNDVADRANRLIQNSPNNPVEDNPLPSSDRSNMIPYTPNQDNQTPPAAPDTQLNPVSPYAGGNNAVPPELPNTETPNVEESPTTPEPKTKEATPPAEVQPTPAPPIGGPPAQAPPIQTPPANTPPAEIPSETPKVSDSNGEYLSAVEQQIFNMVNAEREKAGVPKLTYNKTMEKYARIKSKDMADRNYFAHEDPEGKLITETMNRDGVTYNSWGENIAYLGGNPSDAASQFMNMWMNSQGHRENILSPNFTSMGVGVFNNGNKVYATQEFYR